MHKNLKAQISFIVMGIKTIVAVPFICLLFACGSNSSNEAEVLLQQATQMYENGEHDKALSMIDSLRKTFPKEFDVRKKALKLYQEVELSRAQKELTVVDSTLIVTKNEYEKMKSTVENLKKDGKATAEQFTALTRIKMSCDSLQTKFDVLCAKIRYIRKKQKE